MGIEGLPSLCVVFCLFFGFIVVVLFFFFLTDLTTKIVLL